MFFPFFPTSSLLSSKLIEMPILLRVQPISVFIVAQCAVLLRRMGSILIIILGSDFIDFLEVVLLFCCPSLGHLCGLGWGLVVFFLFLFLVIEVLFFFLIIFFDGSLGSLAIRCDRCDRLSYELCRRSQCIGSGLSLALFVRGRSIYLRSVHALEIPSCCSCENKGWK